MLNINGRCAIVLPDGKELFSKSKELVNIREYLMKTCDLKEIIYLPNKIFTKKLQIAIPIQVPFKPSFILKTKNAAVGTPII